MTTLASMTPSGKLAHPIGIAFCLVLESWLGTGSRHLKDPTETYSRRLEQFGCLGFDNDDSVHAVPLDIYKQSTRKRRWCQLRWCRGHYQLPICHCDADCSCYVLCFQSQKRGWSFSVQKSAACTTNVFSVVTAIDTSGIDAIYELNNTLKQSSLKGTGH
ncbi:hypothetical protein F0562_000976 [Nyssa sinensis]|uniref:Uncharacterized protein n=1 Tax=Nyssa sinensis TaxID=561372 RepID=A0A5J5C5T1_9ASTE|nr:hypothetical protein F0562_000976 [Nyssa sinensis]